MCLVRELHNMTSIHCTTSVTFVATETSASTLKIRAGHSAHLGAYAPVLWEIDKALYNYSKRAVGCTDCCQPEESQGTAASIAAAALAMCLTSRMRLVGLASLLVRIRGGTGARLEERRGDQRQRSAVRSLAGGVAFGRGRRPLLRQTRPPCAAGQSSSERR